MSILEISILSNISVIFLKISDTLAPINLLQDFTFIDIHKEPMPLHRPKLIYSILFCICFFDNLIIGLPKGPEILKLSAVLQNYYLINKSTNQFLF